MLYLQYLHKYVRNTGSLHRNVDLLTELGTADEANKESLRFTAKTSEYVINEDSIYASFCDGIMLSLHNTVVSYKKLNLWPGERELHIPF